MNTQIKEKRFCHSKISQYTLSTFNIAVYIPRHSKISLYTSLATQKYRHVFLNQLQNHKFFTFCEFWSDRINQCLDQIYFKQSLVARWPGMISMCLTKYAQGVFEPYEQPFQKFLGRFLDQFGVLQKPYTCMYHLPSPFGTHCLSQRKDLCSTRTETPNYLWKISVIECPF